MKQMRWENIIGHANTISRMQVLVEEGRVPHALLFVGQEGIGKFLTAQILAAALFCEQENKPCGKCKSCSALLENRHPDLFVISPDGQAIKIEQIRRLQSEVALAPYLADKRVVIIDQADKMNVQSANSLLKTLEEPTGDVVFILIADNRQMLLDTILSRCALVPFQPLSLAILSAALVKKGIASETAGTLAKLSGGSFGKALHLYENDGLKLRDQAFSLVGSGLDFSMEDVWRVSLEMSELDRGKLQELFLYLNMLFRDMLVLHSDETSILLYNVDVMEQLIFEKQRWSKRKLMHAVMEITKVQKMFKANVNARLIVEQFLIKIRDL